MPEHVFVEAREAFEAKSNPYHDPRDGRFTFGPGGKAGDSDPLAIAISDGVYRPAEGAPSLILAGADADPPRGIGDNSGGLHDPMTLEQAFPGLSGAPGGSILAASADVLGLTTPAAGMTTQMSLDYTRALISDIQRIDPSYRYPSLGFPETVDG